MPFLVYIVVILLVHRVHLYGQETPHGKATISDKTTACTCLAWPRGQGCFPQYAPSSSFLP